MPDRTVAIVGGGASGTLLAHALVHAGARVIVIEPRERLGAGVAYSTDCRSHVLNVPAARMSAISGDAHHFLRWLGAAYPNRFSASSFVPRSVYGEYLRAIANEAFLHAGERLRHVRSTALDVSIGQTVRVRCSDGAVYECASLVLACGNADPAPWPGLTQTNSDRCYASAWETGALTPAVADESVVLLGTGLTAIDAVLGLRDNGHRGIIRMISRRGLLPHEHRLLDTPPAAEQLTAHGESLVALSRALTKAAKGAPGLWRVQLDDVRSSTNRLWQSLSLAEQRTFLRHALPYWNVHRHRMAPDVVKRLASLVASGALEIIAGRTARIAVDADGVVVPVRLRRGGSLEVRAARIINCSGPLNDYTRLPNPLIKSLLAQGIMTPNALGIGVITAPDGALIDRHSTASQQIFTIGPVRFGTLIETTAIPEIRDQAAELAGRLAATVAA